MRRLRGLTGLACALMVVAGCTQTPSVTRSSVPPVAPTSLPADEPPTSVDLRYLKETAGIPDCPETDPTVPANDEGLPDVVLPCLGGGRDVRLAGLRGRPVLINVWAQWCVPCRKEAPYIAEVSAVNRSELAVLGINSFETRPDLAIQFAEFASWRYPQIADPENLMRSDLQMAGPPQTLFVRADGSIAYRHAGPFRSADEIRELTREHLGVRP